MSANTGVMVLAPINTFDSTDTYGTHYSDLGIGGFRSSANLAALQAIPTARKKSGMLGLALDTSTFYTLDGDLTTWTALTLSTGGTIGGSGTAGYIPYFTPAGTHLGNSSLSCKPYAYDGSDTIIHHDNGASGGAIISDSVVASNQNCKASKIVSGNSGTVDLTMFGSNYGTYQAGMSQPSSLYGISMNGLTNLHSSSGGGRGLLISQDGNYPIWLGTNGNIVTTISGSGNVGIGTMVPMAPLHVYSTNPIISRMETNSSDATVQFLTNDNSSQTWGLGVAGTANLGGVANSKAFYIRDESKSVPRFVINTNGNIGIGQTDPAAKLDIMQPDSSTFSFLIRFAGNDNGGFVGLPSEARDSTFGILTAGSNGCTANRMISCSAGVANPALSIEGNIISSAHYPVIQFDASTGTSRGSIATTDMGWGFSNNGSLVAKIYGNGDLGCGNISGGNLTLSGSVQGALSITGRLTSSNIKTVVKNGDTAYIGSFPSSPTSGDLVVCVCDSSSSNSWHFVGGVGELDPGHAGIVVYNGSNWVNIETITP